MTGFNIWIKIKMPSIVVVGNGPSVLNNKLGELIDSFDEVVRINHYMPKKKYTGEKLTIFVAISIAKAYEEVPKLAKTIYLRKDVCRNNGYYENFPQTVVLNPSLTRDLLHLKHGFNIYPVKPWASTGVAFLANLIVENKYDKIYIYGFDNLKPGVQEHYFEKHLSNMRCHSHEKEKAFVEYYKNTGQFIRLEDYAISLGIPIEWYWPSNTEKCVNKDCQYKHHTNTNLFEFYCCKPCSKNKGHGLRCQRVNITPYSTDFYQSKVPTSAEVKYPLGVQLRTASTSR